MTHNGKPVVAYQPSHGEADGLSTAQLVSRLGDELSRLVRHEIELAKVQLTQNGKRAGVGAGSLGGAGVLAAYALGCLIAAGIVALAMVIPAWAAALVVGVALLIVAAIAGMFGRKKLRQASPGSVPKETMENLRADVQTVMEHARR